MSSSYESLCLNHNPALASRGSFNSPEGALDHARDERHPRCDILIGRWSGALIEVGCPPTEPGSVRWHPGAHRDWEWVDMAWLRLAAAVWRLDPCPEPVVAALAGLRGWCWTKERVLALMTVEEEQDRG